ncbi:probable RNA-binding protein ARP1 isoform X1 [Cicer arietinum]|uniref:Probable RNA-binding protein ARP1 isoform X1 n=1 Tax=Cicer arietinum TaxID=3827 RepID=A0A1S2XWV3_CICAR|nr:probable RNA-binding protein ARP1 isoform X1 [Cicer arietinum]
MTIMGGSNKVGEFGDTTLTKVFVGGLAWETPKDTLREHFQKYGHILEAVIISDKLTGRSKGYGFVTFKEAEAAKKACEEPTVMINGRRANCNLASLGARRPIIRTSSPQEYSVTKNRSNSSSNHQQQPQWYYPTPTPPSTFHHHFPFYGYTPPTYIATDMNYNYNYNYNQKVRYVYPRQMPVIYHHHQYPIYHTTTEAMGVPAPQFFPAPSIIPTTGPVGTGECFKRVV